MSDLISRQAVINAIANTIVNGESLGYGLAEEIVSEITSVENKGEWILDYRDCGVEFYRCSKCNLGRAVIDGDYYKSLDEFKKCPICGVDMKGGQNGDK